MVLKFLILSPDHHMLSKTGSLITLFGNSHNYFSVSQPQNNLTDQLQFSPLSNLDESSLHMEAAAHGFLPSS